MKENRIPAQRNFPTAGGIAASAKKIVTSKKFVVLMVQCLVMAACVFAAGSSEVKDVSEAITDKLGYVIGIVYSPWVKALFGLVVGVKAVSFIINHEQGTFKKLIPLAGAALIYFAAPSVADKLLNTESATVDNSSGTITVK